MGAPLIDAIDQYYSLVATADHKSHFSVPLPLLIPQKTPDLNLYHLDEDGDDFILLKDKGTVLTLNHVQNWADQGHRHVFVETTDLLKFTQFVEGLLADLPSSSTLADEQKVNLLRKSSIIVMADIFANPSVENINRGVKAVSGFVYLLIRDPKAYSMLMGLSSHDPYTLQHSAGVATNSIILANKIGITDEKSLIEVGVGGLLHDIGKTKVKREIINKPGKLDDVEWAEMKQHPKWGFEILRHNTDVGTRAKLAVLQHHEEPSGSGYPLGLKKDQMDLYAKIVAIADIYNALTTNRPYSNAMPPFEAFKLIKEKLSHKIDDALFQALVMIYGGKS